MRYRNASFFGNCFSKNNNQDAIQKSMRHFVEKRCFPIALFLAFYSPMALAAPEVVTIEGEEHLHNPTDDTLSGLDAGTYRMLVIPVIGSEGAATYDPAESSLNHFMPELNTSLMKRFEGVQEYWLEETWGEINVQPTVIDRYFVMPKPSEDYLNPDFSPAFIESAGSVPSPTGVPEGQLAFDFTLDGATSQIIRLRFDDNDDERSAAELVRKINSQLNLLVGDQIVANYDADSDKLKFDVNERFVREGTSLTVRGANGDEDDDSNFEVLEALGFLDSDRDASSKIVRSLGLELPIEPCSEIRIRFTLNFEDDAPAESLELRLPEGCYEEVQDFIDGAVIEPAGTISLAEVEGEIEYTLMPANSNPVEEIAISVFGSDGRATADDLGLETITRSEGVITRAWRNTIKGDWKKLSARPSAHT